MTEEKTFICNANKMLEKDLEIKSTDKQRRKLVDYLNEYEEGISGEKGHFTYESRFDEVHVISKKFGFIKWLVDKDKIDLEKRPTRNKYRLQQYKTELGGYGKIDEYSELLMLLSISDNPISDLINILK